MKPEKFTNLGRAIHHWLSFQLLCGREQLLSESYLNQPTGEYLLHAAASSHLKTEYDHPCLNEEGRRGRPRQIDFCLLSRDTQRLTTAIELKWITDSAFDKQRIINDLLRLECLSGIIKGQRIYRYLVVAGKTPNFRREMVGLNGGPAPFLEGILATEKSQKATAAYKGLTTSQKELFDSFAAKYKRAIPLRFETILEFKEVSPEFSVYGWHIQCSRNRKTLNPTTSLTKDLSQRNLQTPLSEPVTLTPAQTNPTSP